MTRPTLHVRRGNRIWARRCATEPTARTSLLAAVRRPRLLGREARGTATHSSAPGEVQGSRLLPAAERSPRPDVFRRRASAGPTLRCQRAGRVGGIKLDLPRAVGLFWAGSSGPAAQKCLAKSSKRQIPTGDSFGSRTRPRVQQEGVDKARSPNGTTDPGSVAVVDGPAHRLPVPSSSEYPAFRRDHWAVGRPSVRVTWLPSHRFGQAVGESSHVSWRP
jgi:hypothetical protein